VLRKLIMAINTLKQNAQSSKITLGNDENINDFVGAIGNRSLSDNGTYISAVKEAVSSYRAFSSFKRDPRYQAILEHASREQGEECLAIVKSESPLLLKKMHQFKENDLVGGSTLYEFDDVGAISPSTLRYVKVVADLENIFGEKNLERVAEIGVGYGGQLVVVDKVFKIHQYDLFDLPPVLELTSKYLESHTLNTAYSIRTLNQHKGDIEYDLVVSNYAFSELPSMLQRKYITKVLSKAKRGYLTMNSGKSNSAFQRDKLSLEELGALLPEFSIVQERPVTHPGNYIIVWGHKS